MGSGRHLQDVGARAIVREYTSSANGHAQHEEGVPFEEVD